MGQLLLFIGLAEMVSWIAISQMLMGSGRKPGDFGFDPLNIIKGKSDADVERMQVRELKNGRCRSSIRKCQRSSPTGVGSLASTSVHRPILPFLSWAASSF